MPKIEPVSLTLKISLDQIINSGNIRELEKYTPNSKGEYPQEIIELAQSIKTIGQIQPVVVKLAGETDGVKQYELIAGFRRFSAFKYLCASGEDFNQIDAKIITGNTLTIQLVENIQREDLTAIEREAAIFQLSKTGMKQVEIAAQLSKNKSFVSIHLSAWKMRQAAQKENIDLAGVETSTLAELLSVPDEKLADVLRELVSLGKTRAAASALAKPFKKDKQAEPSEALSNVTTKIEAGNDVDNVLPDPDLTQIDKTENTKPILKPVGKEKTDPPLEKIEAEHKTVDVNIILTVIYDYIKNTEKQIASGKTLSEKNKWGALTKIDAAKDILALIHEKLN